MMDDELGVARTVEESVGEAVRRHRADRNLTIAQFSALTGVSTAMISKIERGRVSASLATLEALAEGLGVPIANLFADTVERREVSFVKPGAGIETHRSGRTFDYVYSLIGRASEPGVNVECYLITIPRNADMHPLLLLPGIEFIHVTQGSMDYRIGDAFYRLDPGASLTFNGDMPHGPQAILSDAVTFLTVTAVQNP